MDANAGIKQWIAICMTVCWIVVIHPSISHAEPAQHGEGGKVEELPAAPAFMTMPPLHIPVVKNNRIAGHLMVDMVLDVATDEAVLDVAENRILLSTGYTAALGKWARTFQDARAPANVIAIKGQLQNVTNEVLGRTDAIVLLQSAMLRR